MENKFNEQKQEADENKDPANVERDGFNAEELGEASAYDSTTEMAQMMRRGDESKGDPDARDVVGSTNAADHNANKPVPRHQRSANDLFDKKPGKK
jgi:hypothetical protein